MGRDQPNIARSRVPWHRRIWIDRGALRYWAAVVLAALVVAALVHTSLGQAENVRSQWGASIEVVVAAEAIAAGDPLGPATKTSRWPRALVPATALDPNQLRGDNRNRGALKAATDLDAGTLITESLALPTSPTANQRLVAITLTSPPPDSQAGDRVDVWATIDPSLRAEGSPPSRRVAREATIIAIDQESMVLGVTPTEVPEMVEALALASITLVGVP